MAQKSQCLVEPVMSVQYFFLFNCLTSLDVIASLHHGEEEEILSFYLLTETLCDWTVAECDRAACP